MQGKTLEEKKTKVLWKMKCGWKALFIGFIKKFKEASLGNMLKTLFFCGSHSETSHGNLTQIYLIKWCQNRNMVIFYIILDLKLDRDCDVRNSSIYAECIMRGACYY